MFNISRDLYKTLCQKAGIIYDPRLLAFLLLDYTGKTEILNYVTANNLDYPALLAVAKKWTKEEYALVRLSAFLYDSEKYDVGIDVFADLPCRKSREYAITIINLYAKIRQ